MDNAKKYPLPDHLGKGPSTAPDEDRRRKEIAGMGGIFGMVAGLFRPVYDNPLLGSRLLGYQVTVDLDAPLPPARKHRRSKMERKRMMLKQSKCRVVGKRFREAELARWRRWGIE